jgi:Starch-binding associating with outer membrane
LKNYKKMTIKFLYKTIICGTLVVSLSSCSEFLDVNTDPNRIADAPLSTQLTGAITSTSSNHYQAGLTISSITQQVASAAANGSADIHNEIRLPGLWTGTYLNAMTNLTDVVKVAATRNSPYYAGIAKVLIAINLGIATDIWGDVPYSDAFNLEKSFYPSYDNQQTVYTNIQTLLDEAITDLGQPTSLFKPSAADDLLYGGNRTKWTKLAKALKARYALHLTKKGVPAAANAAITALTGAMADNSDDMQLVYNTTVINPWHSLSLAINTGNLSVRPSARFADAMNGTTYGVWDPRLPLLTGLRTGTNNTWKGTVNGTGAGGVLDMLVTNFHTSSNAPLLMMTFSEQKFIEAEARFLANGGDANSTGSTAEAYKAYIDGIDANLKKVGASDTARTRYLAAPQVAVGAANLKLTHIMTEKWKALFLHAEAWTDMRRYDYSNVVYKDLALPANHNASLNKQWIRRAEYPLDEFSRNGEQVRKVVKPAIEKMWWDQ